MFVFGCILYSQQAFASVAPIKQIEKTVEEILLVMQDKALSVPEKKTERRTRIMSLIDSRFDYKEMSRISLGKSWINLSVEEKSELIDVFSQLLKQTYIGRIEAYSDEKVEYSKEVFGKEKKTRAMVFTNIHRNGVVIPINYKVLVKNDEWLVYDVVIEGVSLVRSYRTEFSRIIAQEEISGLVKRIRDKVEKSAIGDN